MNTQDKGSIHVFTFKDGLLARLAHDLRLSLGRFEIRREGTALSGRFWPATLKVDGVVGKDGRVDVDGLGAGDKAKIQRNITDEILLTAQHPEVSFNGALTPGGCWMADWPCSEGQPRSAPRSASRATACAPSSRSCLLSGASPRTRRWPGRSSCRTASSSPSTCPPIPAPAARPRPTPAPGRPLTALPP
ncbi:hypothetical protein [Nannocystis pusilla]|uniref:hypothetical protein n=1 Tax=Nannocystis pusilla TaxID=889268 RepID=UPI003B803C99